MRHDWQVSCQWRQSYIDEHWYWPRVLLVAVCVLAVAVVLIQMQLLMMKFRRLFLFYFICYALINLIMIGHRWEQWSKWCANCTVVECVGNLFAYSSQISRSWTSLSSRYILLFLKIINNNNELMNEALAIRQALLGELHQDTAQSHNSLGCLHQDLGVLLLIEISVKY